MHLQRVGIGGGVGDAAMREGVVLQPLAGQDRVAKLWQQFFRDPSQWWDHRPLKTTPKYPDFKHKKTHEALWIDGRLNPQWVKPGLAAMAPGTVQKSVFFWTAIIAACVKSGDNVKALKLFQQMQKEGIRPDKFTFVYVLNACANMGGGLEEGRWIHMQILKSNCESDIFVGNALIDMYAKGGSMLDASRVFHGMLAHDVVSWSALILGWAKCGQGEKALDLFHLMQQQENLVPNEVTFVGAITACANMGASEEGSRIHSQALQIGCLSDVFVGSSLVDMYIKCGNIENAFAVFRDMPVHNVVCYNVMIHGLIKCGLAERALQLFEQMNQKLVKPDKITYSSALSACASLAALGKGRQIHAHIIASGCHPDITVENGLINMYAKSGSIREAYAVFNCMRVRDIVSWNVMLDAYATHGLARQAFWLLEKMLQEGLFPNSATFTFLLSACSRSGFLEEGLFYCESMNPVYGTSVSLKHYNCMVDLLGRAGYLIEAEDIANRMSCEPDVLVWRTLLAACNIHENVAVGKRAASRAFDLDPANAPTFVLLSNIHPSVHS